jgi:hypothetical protein
LPGDWADDGDGNRLVLFAASATRGENGGAHQGNKAQQAAHYNPSIDAA